MFRRSLLLLFVVFAPAAFAQNQHRESDTIPRVPVSKPVFEISRTSVPPQVDGHVNDEAWAQARTVGDFWQREPAEGQPASERTEARILYDDNALYVAFICYDSEPDKITRRLSRRDRDVPSDKVGIYLDSYDDDRTAFQFMVNAAGVKIDLLMQDDGENSDLNWDGIWEARTALRPDGWSAEFRIPFQTLRFSPDKPDWGLNLLRIISRKSEYDYWAYIPRTGGGFVSRFGSLTGLRDLDPPRSILVMPYGLAGGTRYPESDFSGRLDQYSPEYRVGVDVQYGLSSNSTLNLTVNPDFGQVEVDAVVLNLSAFETFFPEKRPFFLEGTDIFQTIGALGDDGPRSYLFYSRRIGRQPGNYYNWPDGYSEDDWLVADNPAATPILAAAKLSGKTENGWSYGVLNALTRETSLHLEHAQTRETFSMQTEPMTNYAVARIQRKLPGAASYVGLIGTGVLRNGDGFTNAYSGGLDWRYNTSDYRLSMEGIISTTQRDLPGDEGWQRGFQVQARVGSFSHKNFLVQGGATYTSPDFNPNDIGYNTEANQFMQFFWGQYRQLDPTSFYREFRYNLSLWNWHTIEPWTHGNYGGSTNVHFRWLNYWQTSFGLNGNTRGNDPYEARREGFFYRRPESLNGWFYTSTDQRENVSVYLNFGGSVNAAGGSSRWMTPGVNFKLGAATQLDLSPSIQASANQTGWVTSADDFEAPGLTTTIFGNRDVEQVNLTLRGLHTFTRDITLQGYVQYFWARGEYDDFRKLNDDGTLGDLSKPYDREEYRNPDFNQSAFNVNLIGRWEYRPGSTLFLVWTHNRNAFLRETNRTFGPFFDYTFELPSTNVVLVKWTYAIGM